MKKEKSSYTRIEALPLQSCRWSDGFWKRRMDLCSGSILPNIHDLFDSDEISHNLANFRIASGAMKGDFEGPPFGDGDFYKWLEAASYLYGLEKDPSLKTLVDDCIALIAAVQREDGYIYTEYSIDLINGRKREEGVNALSFEAYNLGHLITAGCVHFQATGEMSLLKLAIKAGDYLCSTFVRVKEEGDAQTSICPSHYMALVELYQVTGERKYLETAQLAVELRDTVKGGTDDNQDRVSLLQATKIVGHAVRATYLYAGVADLYAAFGDRRYLDLLSRLYDDLENHKMYINSGIGALYDGVSPSGFAGDHPDLARTHQSFGRAYELPNVTAYNETCATIGNIFWSWRMFLITKDARFADRIEQSFYNLVFASVSLDGKKYFYSNMLERENERLPFHLKWERTRTPYLSSFCCPPNMLRITCESSEYAYAQSEDGISICLYGESIADFTLKGNDFSLHQETGYPYSGKIVISYHGTKATSFALDVRIPSWVRKGSISYEKKILYLGKKDANSLVPVYRIWKDGESIEIDFSMDVRLVAANSFVEEDSCKVAVQRGPLLYCAEGIDNGNDYLLLKKNAIFKEVRTVMEGEGIIALESDDAIAYPWLGNSLYVDVDELCCKPSHIRLIPYYTWDNRAFGRMQVWFPMQLQ